MPLKTLGDVRQAALDLCGQIEKCGASEELTRASIMASELHTAINELMPEGVNDGDVRRA